MNREPGQYRLLVLHSPAQLVRLTVRHPRREERKQPVPVPVVSVDREQREALAVDVQYILTERQIVVVHDVGRPSQAGSQILPLHVELRRIVFMVEHLVVIIQILASSILFS